MDELGPLEGHLAGRVCVVGIGNRLAGDDGAGSAVAEKLAERAPGYVIDAGIAPENHLEPIVRGEPDTILLVDAVEFGGEPGSVRLFDPRALRAGGLSTHATSLGIVTEYLAARCAARIVLLGIQPGRLRLGTALSDEVASSVGAVARRLAELMEAARPAGAGADPPCPAPGVEEPR